MSGPDDDNRTPEQKARAEELARRLPLAFARFALTLFGPELDRVAGAVVERLARARAANDDDAGNGPKGAA